MHYRGLTISPELSVVMPAYNESETIHAVLAEVSQEILDRVKDTEIIIVDDGSTDQTPDLLARLAKDYPQLRVERLGVNQGHGPALHRCLELTQGEWIFITDADGQLRMSEFGRLWDQRNDADLIMGIRVNRQDPLHRRVLSRFLWLGASLLTLRSFRDSNVPFKLFRKDLWEDLRPAFPASPQFPSVMISLGAVLRGWRILQVPISHRPRVHGTTAIRRWRLIGMAARSFLELLRFRFRVLRV